MLIRGKLKKRLSDSVLLTRATAWTKKINKNRRDNENEKNKK